jgi:hypothetical protein
MKKEERFQFKLDRDLKGAIDFLAKEQGISKGETVRKLIVRGLSLSPTEFDKKTILQN